MAKKRPKRRADREELTRRQEQIYKYICKYDKMWGIKPTVREIQEHFEIKSPQGVTCHLDVLERKHWIGRYKDTSRGLIIFED